MTTTKLAPKPVARPEDKFTKRPIKPLPQSLVENSRLSDKQSFDADKHVNFVPPARVYTMKELGLEGQGISSTAVTEPFPLFTEEAVRQMRGELLSEHILQKHQYASSFATNMIRGACPEDAPFVNSAWTNPRVLEAISQAAGIDLVPVWSFDVGHLNICVQEDRVEIPQSSESEASKEEDYMSAFGWHYDSTPFVCVTMLSDCTGMRGGETMIRTGDGSYMKMRGPAMGTAVVMQGRYLEHQALKALGGRERISMVTSLRPKSALVRDETVLTGVRGISYLPELYYQYASYRYRNLEERMEDQLKKIRDRHDSKQDFDLAAARAFLMEQRDYIDSMLSELVEVK